MKTKKVSNIVLLSVLSMASLWDGFTTVYGSIATLGNDPTQVVVSILLAALIISLLLNTSQIFNIKKLFTRVLSGIFWVTAVCYDLYTSWIGNSTFVIKDEKDTAQLIILFGLTMLVTGSPILLSLLWNEMNDNYINHPYRGV